MKTCLLCLIFLACGQLARTAETSPVVRSASTPSPALGDTSFRLIPTVGNTWGYEILVDGRALIRQTTIPGQPGSRGFRTKKDAAKIAALVLGKLKQGQMPPTVYKEDMDRLKINY